MTTEFGRLLKDARRRRGLTQKQVATAASVLQPTVSDWENGRQLPSKEDIERFSAFAEILGVPVDHLSRAARQRPREFSSVHLLSERGYLDEQQDHLREIGPANTELWLLGPETLPVIHSKDVAAVWQQNLADGVDYCILWFLDLVVPKTLFKLAGHLRSIVEQSDLLNPKGGRIRHYPLLALSEQDDESLKEYEWLKRGGPPRNDFNKLIGVDGRLKRQLQQYYIPYGSTTVSLPKEPTGRSQSPFAAVSLTACRHSRCDDPGRGFFILADEHALSLSALIADLRALYGGSGEPTLRQ